MIVALDLVPVVHGHIWFLSRDILLIEIKNETSALICNPCLYKGHYKGTARAKWEEGGVKCRSVCSLS